MELRSITIAAVLLACGTAGATAQDGGFDWTGGYVGGSLAYTSANSNAAFVPSSPYASVPITSLPHGFTGEVQGGVNQQMGNFVIGAEADVGIGSITTTFPDPLLKGLGAGDTVTASSDIQASLRGRFGVAVGNFLPYVTGGVALAHLKTSATNSVGSPLADEGIGYGWTVGVGTEVALDESWSIRAQYLHTDITAPNFYAGETYENSAHPVSDTIALGVNYRFN